MLTRLAHWQGWGAWLVMPFLVVTLGCAHTQDGTMDKKTVGAGIGAAVGAAIGAVTGRDAKSVAAGAVAGAALGYAAGWLAEKYAARQVRNAEQVKQAYGAPPVSGPPQVHAYKTWIDPDAIRRGTAAGWVSSFDVQVPPGMQTKVAEERLFLDPDGNTISRRTYDYSGDVTGTGGYEFELTIPIPANAPEGKYSYETHLTVDGAPKDKLQGSFQIAADGRVSEVTVACVTP
ncbi:MAG TPA: hypothetical protein DC005_00900 [Proteobacteria bacterium]|nr:hypothetical protein [Pseudomonadota bacterium]